MDKSFKERVYLSVQKIPKGKVATYGMVALMAGNARAARAVGNILHVNPLPGIIPCHRVVNSKGLLSGCFAFGGDEAQKQLLEAEGVKVCENKVDLDKYLM